LSESESTNRGSGRQRGKEAEEELGSPPSREPKVGLHILKKKEEEEEPPL